MSDKKPIIGVTADSYIVDHQAYQLVGDKYLHAITDVVGGIPFVLPVISELAQYPALIDKLDGILLTGSDSNVHPHYYNDTKHYKNMLLDTERDSFVLSLIPLILKQRLPVMAICRGFQEMNVALGGSLHQMVHEVKGMQDHRENGDIPRIMRYEPVHAINVVPGGLLERLLNKRRLYVNSLHSQGIKTIAPKVRVEAYADDGLVEAISLPNAKGFALAVQWHPEWQVVHTPMYKILFDAFRTACRNHMKAK